MVMRCPGGIGEGVHDGSFIACQYQQKSTEIDDIPQADVLLEVQETGDQAHAMVPLLCVNMNRKHLAWATYLGWALFLRGERLVIRHMQWFLHWMSI